MASSSSSSTPSESHLRVYSHFHTLLFCLKNPNPNFFVPCHYIKRIMVPFSNFLILFSTLFFVTSTAYDGAGTSSSIYEVLKLHGLPMGLLPKGVKDFILDNSGKFEVHLDRACIAKFENELHYERNVSGTLRYGQIDELSGISAQDLFLWFPVKEIRVDIPSSGLIYFDVGVVSKQFSLSSFETPRDCLAVQLPDLQDGRHIAQSVSKSLRGKLQYHDLGRTASS